MVNYMLPEVMANFFLNAAKFFTKWTRHGLNFLNGLPEVSANP